MKKTVFQAMGTLSLIPVRRKYEIKTPEDRMKASFQQVVNSFYKVGNSLRQAAK